MSAEQNCAEVVLLTSLPWACEGPAPSYGGGNEIDVEPPE
jgi:hypothetical protein